VIVVFVVSILKGGSTFLGLRQAYIVAMLPGAESPFIFTATT